MTVSRVINERGNVNPEMRDRVLAAARELGYVRNASASRLRSPHRGELTIGLILRDIANPFSAEMHRGVEDELRSSNSLVLTASNDDSPSRTEYLVRAMREHRADGLIIAPPPGDQDYLIDAVDRGVPVVLVDRAATGNIDVPYVICDGFQGVRDAVLHLASFGHRRIAFLGDELSVPMENRRDGFIAGLAAAGIPREDSIMLLDQRDAARAEICTRELLSSEDPPTAIVSGRNRIAASVVRALQSLGLEHTVAHVGFDEQELAASLRPALTVIAQDPIAMGSTAGKILLELATGATKKAESVVFPTRLIPRGSGEIAPRS